MRSFRMRTPVIVIVAAFQGLTGAFAASPAESDLVNVQTINPRIRVELRYATQRNFLGRALYSNNTCYLRRSVALKLSDAQKLLEKMGVGLKVWDGFRPRDVQEKFWAILPDRRYVADPARGSRHNRGAAVDVTLVTVEGKEVEMPTDFDDFSKRAGAYAQGHTPKVLANRHMLQRAMVESGFKILATEWWHFDDAEWEKFCIIDHDPKQPARSANR